MIERKPGAWVRLDIGGGVEIGIKAIKGEQVKLAIRAPDDVRMLREEVRRDPTKRLALRAPPASGETEASPTTPPYDVLHLSRSESE